MSCCGGSRSNWRNAAPLPAPQPMRASASVRNGVQLRFRGPGSIVVRGAATGLTYAFQGAVPQTVDGRDAPLLLKTGRFVA